MFKKKITIFYTAIIIFILDRLSKYIIIELSSPLERLNIPVTSFLNLNLVWNKGIAFGLLSFNEQFYYNIITLVIIIVTLAVLYLAIKTENVDRVCFSMIFGGSLGNLFDRLHYSAVIDFIDINFNNIHWFIFNIADIFISLGVIMLILFEFFAKKKNMKKFFIFIIFLSLLNACQSTREGFTLKKRETDEFLVEKKNPLVMPPEYRNLPVPENFQKRKTNNIEDDFETIISNSKTKSTKNKLKKTSIEQSVLGKIN